MFVEGLISGGEAMPPKKFVHEEWSDRGDATVDLDVLRPAERVEPVLDVERSDHLAVELARQVEPRDGLELCRGTRDEEAVQAEGEELAHGPLGLGALQGHHTIRVPVDRGVHPLQILEALVRVLDRPVDRESHPEPGALRRSGQHPDDRPALDAPDVGDRVGQVVRLAWKEVTITVEENHIRRALHVLPLGFGQRFDPSDGSLRRKDETGKVSNKNGPSQV